MDDLGQIRPKFKQDSVFLQTKEGVFFQRSDKSTFRLKGNAVYHWLTTLIPYMTGERKLEELCDGLSSSQRALVYQLVDHLLQRGVLKDEQPETSGSLPETVYTRFRPQIEFIDHYVNQPIGRFRRFRESRILLIGEGESYLALARVLIDNGLEELFLAPVNQAHTYIERLASKVEEFEQKGIAVQISPVSSWEQPSALADYDLIAYCSDSGSLRDVYALNQLCRQSGKVLAPAIAFAGQVLIGPLVEPQQGPCWLCAQMRLSANSDNGKDAAIWRDILLGADGNSQETTLFSAVARRMGNGLGFELFKLLTGCLPTEMRGGVIFQDIETLETAYGKLLRHPLCPVCAQSDLESGTQRLNDIVAGKRDQDLDVSEVVDRTTRLINARTGAFHRFDEGRILQLPIKVTRLKINSPTSPLAGKLDVTAYSVENVLDARYAAIQEAIKTYTKALPELRGQISTTFEALVEDGKRAIPAHQLAIHSGVTKPAQALSLSWLPGVSLFNQQFTYVPSAAVYPLSRLNRYGVFERTSAGAAVGQTYEKTILAGLLSALAYEHLRALARGQASLFDLEQAVASSSEKNCIFLLQSIHRFERPFAIWEVLHDSPVHVTIASTTDEQAELTYALGVAPSGLEAAQQAMLGLVGNLQLLQLGEEPSSMTKALFPWLSPGVLVPAGEPQRSRFAAPASTLEQIKQYLHQRGRDAIFVNTTTSDVWETNTLISATVLLTRAEQ